MSHSFSKLFMKGVAAGGMMAAALGAGPALADPKEDAVAARQGYFKLLSANIGPLAAMAKGAVAYDADAARTHGGNLEALGQINIAHLFLEGTDNGAMAGKTRSLPVIWSDLGGFVEKAQAFTAATTGLGDKVGGGLDGLRGALGGVGQTCKACHDGYRSK